MYVPPSMPMCGGQASEAVLTLDDPKGTSPNGVNQPHFMLVPSLACPAACSYCFGPHQGPTMSPQTMESVLEFVARIAAQTRQKRVKVTFHGGEPLLAGHALWRQALEGLRKRFGPSPLPLFPKGRGDQTIPLYPKGRGDQTIPLAPATGERGRGEGGYEVAVQSNLWLLDDEFCELFCDHRVEVGTSLDGPKEITDAQRGPGYFARTMQGIRKAEDHGLRVGCIATFTPASARRWREVFDFFLSERLDFSIHAAVPSLDHRNARMQLGSMAGTTVGARFQRARGLSPGTLETCPHSGTPKPNFLNHAQNAISPEQYGELLCVLLDYYVEHRRDLSVSSLDQMCQGFGCGAGKVCTFRDCLGMFLVIDPAGDIFSCQRFCGRRNYRFGNVADQPCLEELLHSSVAQRMRQREQRVREACNGCTHFGYCRGGCPYNAWATGDNDCVQDPYCPAYRAAFDHIQARLHEEVASARNIEAMAERPYNGRGHPLLREGPLIDLVRAGAASQPGGPHRQADCGRSRAGPWPEHRRRGRAPGTDGYLSQPGVRACLSGRAGAPAGNQFHKGSEVLS